MKSLPDLKTNHFKIGIMVQSWTTNCLDSGVVCGMVCVG